MIKCKALLCLLDMNIQRKFRILFIIIAILDSLNINSVITRIFHHRNRVSGLVVFFPSIRLAKAILQGVVSLVIYSNRFLIISVIGELISGNFQITKINVSEGNLRVYSFVEDFVVITTVYCKPNCVLTDSDCLRNFSRASIAAVDIPVHIIVLQEFSCQRHNVLIFLIVWSSYFCNNNIGNLRFRNGNILREHKI